MGRYQYSLSSQCSQSISIRDNQGHLSKMIDYLWSSLSFLRIEEDRPRLILELTLINFIMTS